MKSSIRLSLIVFAISLISLIEGALGSSYHWPLGIRSTLTSAFAEYRGGLIRCQSGHLHSGIDLKTWGQTGYEVYAVDSGYIQRVRVSPWGYGKAIYLRLMDGRIAVYAHLSDFTPGLRSLVEERQEKLGKYSVDIHFLPGTLKVKRGQLIGYSGESGSGGPHLHFEIRDGLNCPLNPLTHGFSIPDTIPPTIVALSAAPLDASSTVNQSHSPIIVPLIRVKSCCYRTDQVIKVSGRIGFGVLAYDQTNDSDNRLGIYSLELFLDDEIYFTAEYDHFCFEKTHKVDLDRDYRLLRWDLGKFYRLYQEVGNDLPFYGPRGSNRGVLDTFATGGDGRRVMAPGIHTIRVVVRDTNGNSAIAELQILVDEPPALKYFLARRNSGKVWLEVGTEDQDGSVQGVHFEVSTDQGGSWQMVAVDSTGTPEGIYQAKWPLEPEEVVLFRAQAVDDLGLASPPGLVILKGEASGLHDREKPQFNCQLRFWDDFVELNLESNEVLSHSPQVTITQTGGETKLVGLTPTGVKSYTGVYRFLPYRDGLVTVEVKGRDIWGNEGRYDTTFVINTITPERGGEASRPGERVWVVFEPGSVYKTLFVRIEKSPVTSLPDLPLVSPSYSLFPMDVPFARLAKVAIGYPPSLEAVEKVGLYFHDEQAGWKYVGQQIDPERKSICASVSAFGTFALLKDLIPPRVWDLKPEDGSRIKNRRPTLFARVKDRGSDIGSEEDVVMELDGRKLISEYDPEKHTVQYQPKRPLDYGRHVLTISVRDRARNRTVRKSTFWVVK